MTKRDMLVLGMALLITFTAIVPAPVFRDHVAEAGERIEALVDRSQEPLATATPEIPDCVATGKVGVNTIYRCEDMDIGTICYWNPLAAGVLDCLDN